ncbi:unnamed protein product [Owenia fusiformis]|uniref:Uncharacterized protein n=1 Tax=Owenia fusiformis TaxID=6347 RepID=A0A8S4NMC3_OWEFU|nr:unnamed protein product [Owenia fusiformis]
MTELTSISIPSEKQSVKKGDSLIVESSVDISENTAVKEFLEDKSLCKINENDETSENNPENTLLDEEKTIKAEISGILKQIVESSVDKSENATALKPNRNDNLFRIKEVNGDNEEKTSIALCQDIMHTTKTELEKIEKLQKEIKDHDVPVETNEFIRDVNEQKTLSDKTSDSKTRSTRNEDTNCISPEKNVESEIDVEASHVSETYESISDACLRKYNSLKKKLSSFANVTSIQPFINIRNADTMSARLVWFLIAFCVWSIVLNGVTEITSKYLSFPTENSLYNREELVTFPSITLCPVLPVIFNNTWRLSFEDMLFQLHSQNIETYFSDNKSVHENLIAPIMDRVVRKEGYLDLVGDKVRLRTYSDLIIECRFNGELCNETDFINVTVGSYGNCYTFDTYSTDIFDVSETGPDFGLRLVLFLNSYSPLDELISRDDFKSELREFNSNYATLSDGIRMAIHAPGTMPDMDIEGIDLSPGKFITIGLAQDVRTLLEPPYGECTNEQNNKDTPYAYTVDLCLRQCQQELMIAKCGCMTYNGPVPPNTNVSQTPYCGQKVKSMYFQVVSNVPYIVTNNKFEWDEVIKWSDLKEILQVINCEKNVTKMVSVGNQTCGCKKQCVDIVYDPLVHSVPWPNEKYYKGINRRNFIRFLRQQPKIARILNENLFHNDIDSIDSQREFCDIVNPFNYVKNAEYREPPLFYTDTWPYLDCIFNLRDPSNLYDYGYYYWYHNLYDGDPTINKYNIVNKIIEKNFLKVNIYYRSLTVNTIAEEQSYPLNKYLSELGGIIGMYAGMSAVSIVELASLLVPLLLVLCRYRRRF